MTDLDRPTIGVVIVAFQSADVIIECLDSLIASQGVKLRIAVTDNLSVDDGVTLIRDWAARRGRADPDFRFVEAGIDDQSAPGGTLTLLHSPYNGGYAHGVNAGLRLLLRDPSLDLFWVLNPDCVVMPDTALHYAQEAGDKPFSLMTGRTLYVEEPTRIQTDGGRVDRWTGVCSSVNAGQRPDDASPPDPASLDFVTGGNMVASRRFIEAVGLMEESYFLYYEEVEWALRRGNLPLRIAPRAIVRHHGGTAIGSGIAGRRASPFANYFNFRNRIRLLRRHRPWTIPFGLAHAVGKAAQLTMQGARSEAWAALAGALGRPPPPAVRDRIAPGKSRELAFGE